MILLLGGTSETSSLAEGLAEAGYDVLVSTATDAPLAVGTHPRIRRRSGRLDGVEMARLIREAPIRAIVDATHPYAALARKTARAVSGEQNIPYFTFYPAIGHQVGRKGVFRQGTTTRRPGSPAPWEHRFS